MSYDDARDLRAIWFGDTVAMLGHLHTPRRDAADLALVICPAPFGYDNVCGHRGLRILADRVAASGIPALRFDPPGTGDSDGTQRVAAWTAAIGSAVAALRRETGCQRIVVMGVGLGGSVALAAADGGLELDGLILWGAPTRGRAWLREQRAYQRVAAIVPDPDVPAPPAPREGIEELSGFPLTSDLAADLVALDLGVVPDGSWPDGRPRPDVLAISRTSRGDESGLAAAPRHARPAGRARDVGWLRQDVRRAAPVDRARAGLRGSDGVAGGPAPRRGNGPRRRRGVRHGSHRRRRRRRGDRALLAGRRREAVLDRDAPRRARAGSDLGDLPDRARSAAHRSEQDVGALRPRARRSRLRLASARRPQRRRQRRRGPRPDAERGVLPALHLG